MIARRWDPDDERRWDDPAEVDNLGLPGHDDLQGDDEDWNDLGRDPGDPEPYISTAEQLNPPVGDADFDARNAAWVVWNRRRLNRLPRAPRLSIVADAPDPRLDPDFEIDDRPLEEQVASIRARAPLGKEGSRSHQQPDGHQPRDEEPGEEALPDEDQRQRPDDRRPPGLSRVADLAEPANAGTWWIQDVIRPGTVGLMAGAEGLSKTDIAVQMAIQLATAPRCGALFGHYAIPAPVTVALYDEENGEAELWRREERLLRHFSIERRELGDRYWRSSFAGTRLADRGSQHQLTEQLKRLAENGPVLAFFDTVTVMVDGDEWGSALRPVIRFLRQLVADVGDLSVWGLVHMRKPSGKQQQGRQEDPTRRALHDVIGNWARHVDAVAILSDLGAGRRRWQMEKRVPPSSVVLSGEAGAWIAVADNDLQTDDRVLAAIDAAAPTILVAAKIAADLGVSERTVERSVKRLRDADILVSRGPLRRSER